MKKAALVYTDRYREYDFGPNHPMKPIRQRMTYDLIHAYGLLKDPGALEVVPEAASEADLLTVHSEAYVGVVKKLGEGKPVHGTTRFGFGILDNPPFRGMYDASCLYTGGSIVAGRIVSGGEARVAFNPAGGLHHAQADRASGFCIFDDAAVAINRLLDRHERVLYLDIDAHHGDGVQAAFYGSRRVMTISQHESGQFLFPGSGAVEEIGSGEGAGYAVNIPLMPYTDDETYLWAFREVVPPLVARFDPEIIVFQMGTDAHYQDPLAHLNLTTSAYGELFGYALGTGKPILALGGGGYHLETVPRVWTLAFAAFLGRDLADEIPEEYARTYGIYRLRDTAGPKLWSSETREVRDYARATVDRLRKLVFPIHGM